MSKREKIFEMSVGEWRGLAGLADPYTIASVQVGVPKSVSLSLAEGVVVEDLRSSEEIADEAKRFEEHKQALIGFVRGEGEVAEALRSGLQDGLGYDDLFEIYLEGNGIPYAVFHTLLDEALLTDDGELAGELLLAEEEFDEIIGAIAKGAQAVGKVGAKVGKAALGVGAKVVKSVVGKGAQMAGAVAGKMVTPAPTAAAPAPKQDAPTPGADAPAPTPAAPKPTADAPAPTSVGAPGGPAAAPAAGPAQAHAAGAAQTQAPAAAMPPKPQQAKQKPQGKFAKLGAAMKQTVGGVVGLPKSAAVSASRLGKKPQMSSVDDELWGDFLAERGIDIGQFHILMDEAIETGDREEMASLVAVEDVFEQWKDRHVR